MCLKRKTFSWTSLLRNKTVTRLFVSSHGIFYANTNRVYIYRTTSVLLSEISDGFCCNGDFLSAHTSAFSSLMGQHSIINSHIPHMLVNRSLCGR